MHEMWLPVKDYPWIEVSNLGNERRLGSADFKETYTEPKLREFNTKPGNYKLINLRKEGKLIITELHNIIASVFLGPKPKEMLIDHRDREKHNNEVTNLRYVTYKDNALNKTEVSPVSVYERKTGFYVDSYESASAASLALNKNKAIVGNSLREGGHHSRWHFINDAYPADFKIAEWFKSVQSEGKWAGYPALFIRLHDCNLNCKFGDGQVCDDLAHSSGNYKWSSLNDLTVLAENCELPFIVITGGEASNDPKISTLIKGLKDKGFKVSVETNGNNIERLYLADLITYSPKSIWDPDARKVAYEEYQNMNEGEMPEIELKVLHSLTYPIDPAEWIDWPLKYAQAINGVSYINIENATAVSEFVTAHPEWKMSFQTHKITGVK